MKKQTLTGLQKIVLTSLAESNLKNDFYWTGGTALAFFYLGHRLSYDIDLFSSAPFKYETIIPLVKIIAQKTKLEKIEEKKVFDRWDFFLKNNDEARLEFVHYDFPALGKKDQWQGVRVDSLTDLVANKTMVLIDRHDPKDAFDIYYILTKLAYSPEKLLDLTGQKFNAHFPLSVFWSNCLIGAQQLKTLQPLIKIGKPEKIILEIIDYFEKKSAESLKMSL